jgi:unsaturated chondroitin disaccharide hydrolase
MTNMASNETAIAPMSVAGAEAAIADVVAQVRRNLPDFTYAAQNHSSVNNFYPAVANDQWTSGFWPGSIWLAYEATGDKTFRYAAQIHVQTLLHRIRNRIATDHHDMGFMYSPSCVSAWRMLGDEDAREAALLASDQLCERFHEKGEFLQAWGARGAPGNYRFIIDCLLNLPLLYWATEETGKPHYRDIARRHLATSLKYSIRPDYSTYHTFFMDPETGAPSHGATQQGYADDSNWARGQAWAITGTAFLYRLERTDELREAFERLLAFYLARLPDDLVPYWDLIFTDGDEPRDSSSAAVVACGLLEMAGEIGGDTGAAYRDLAARMLGSLARSYAVRDPATSNGFLLHGTYSKKTPYNGCKGEGADECVAWGDYFYLEALTRLSRAWKPYW